MVNTNKDTSKVGAPEKPGAPSSTSQPTGQAATGTVAFKFERVKVVPTSGGGGGKQKYDWASFPAPDPNAEEPYATTFIENVTAKPIYTSIRKYRAKLADEKQPDREFTVRVSKDPKGVWVYRTK